MRDPVIIGNFAEWLLVVYDAAYNSRSITRHMCQVMLFMRMFFIVAPMCGTDPWLSVEPASVSSEKREPLQWLAHLTYLFPGSSKPGQLHSGAVPFNSPNQESGVHLCCRFFGASRIEFSDEMPLL
jgi:hypothetical protein